MYSNFDKNALRIWRGFFGLAAIQGIFFLWVFLISKSANGGFLGLSQQRIFILIGPLVFLIFTIWNFIGSYVKPSKYEIRAYRWFAWLALPPRLGYLILLTVILLIISSYSLMLYPEITEPYSHAILGRLLPVNAWFCGLSAQTLILLIYIRKQTSLKLNGPKNRIFWIVLFYFCLTLIGWIWLVRTSIQSVSDRIGWNALGVPVLEYQVFLAWGAGMAIILLTNLSKGHILWDAWQKKQNQRWFDLLISAVLWFGAVCLWNSQPILPNWFVSERLAPNYEHYPYSDARAYDEVAQSALIGNGFRFYNNAEVRRPLHAAYLTILHLIRGQNYENLISAQVLVLALLPVGLYLLGKTMFNRASGVMAAVVVILRESNSIAVASNITSSHSKLILVDLLTALLVVYFAYFAVRWLKQVENISLEALLSGGMLGMAILVRLETFVLALSPLLLSGFILIPRKAFKKWCKQTALFFLGITLVISPWMVRNWQQIGTPSLEPSLFRYQLIIQRFRPQEKSTPAPLITEQPTAGGLSPRVTQSPTNEPPLINGDSEISLPTQTVETSPTILKAKSLLTSAFQKPGELVHIFAAHYLNNQIQMLLLHPTSYRAIESGINFFGHRLPGRYWEECCSVIGYTRRLPFWNKWNGSIPLQSVLPLLITILILTTGIYAAFKRLRLVGFLPGLCALVYIIFNSALRNSGGRYLLPVDWASILYFAVGANSLTLLAISLVAQGELQEVISERNAQVELGTSKRKLLRSPAFYTAVFGLLAFGSAIPLVERGFPKRYSIETRDQMLERMLSAQPFISTEDSQNLREFLARGGIAMAGKGLYPQIFPPGYGTQESDKGPRAAQPYPRLVFNLVGSSSLDITLPLKDKSILFPNGSDTLVLFCLDESRSRADPIAVGVFDSERNIKMVFLRSPLPQVLACPLSSKP